MHEEKLSLAAMAARMGWRQESMPSAPPPADSQFATYCGPPSVWPGFMVGQEDQPARVLLVDDDAHMRTVIAQELMGDPRTLLVAQAGSVKEGRRCIRQTAFDVMLVDLNLSDGDGFALIETMKAQRPSAEAIVISVMEAEQHALHAFELGATGFLVKNSWFGSFPQAVLQVVNGGASITPHLARRLLLRLEHAEPGAARSPTSSAVLSCREKEILRMVSSGHTSAEIGRVLAISCMTVNTHVKNIYRKLQVRTRAQAVSCAALKGLL